MLKACQQIAGAAKAVEYIQVNTYMANSSESKFQALRTLLTNMRRVIVAFSAGVDSTVVLKVAIDTLGSDNVLAATGVSPSLAERELQSVRDLAALMHAPLELVPTSEMENPNYYSNPTNRCYYCKSELYGKLTALAKERGYPAIANGVNLDDMGDYRPGIKAGNEFAIQSPLRDALMTKIDVRELAHRLQLPNWEKPALACLSSRVPYGTPITLTSLSQIGRAEAFLRDHGIGICRVRHHQKLARIEVELDDLSKVVSEPFRSELVSYFRKLGYTYIALDLSGFRSGSGNEVLIEASSV